MLDDKNCIIAKVILYILLQNQTVILDDWWVHEYLSVIAILCRVDFDIKNYFKENEHKHRKQLHRYHMVK